MDWGDDAHVETTALVLLLQLLMVVKNKVCMTVRMTTRLMEAMVVTLMVICFCVNHESCSSKFILGWAPADDTKLIYGWIIGEKQPCEPPLGVPHMVRLQRSLYELANDP